MTRGKKAETNGYLTANVRVQKCGEMIQKALEECGCRMYTALKIGSAEAPLIEIGGLPIVVKVACDSEIRPAKG